MFVCSFVRLAGLEISCKCCFSEQFLRKYGFRGHFKHGKLNDFLENTVYANPLLECHQPFDLTFRRPKKAFSI